MLKIINIPKTDIVCEVEYNLDRTPIGGRIVYSGLKVNIEDDGNVESVAFGTAIETAVEAVANNY